MKELLHIVPGSQKVESEGLDAGEDVLTVEWVPVCPPLVEEVLKAARTADAAAKQARAAAQAPVFNVPLELPDRGDLGAGVLLELLCDEVPWYLPRLMRLVNLGAELCRECYLAWGHPGDEDILLWVDV